MSHDIIDFLRIADPEIGDASRPINRTREQDLALERIERAALGLAEASVARGKTVALLSAGQDRIDSLQVETRTFLDRLVAAR